MFFKAIILSMTFMINPVSGKSLSGGEIAGMGIGLLFFAVVLSILTVGFCRYNSKSVTPLLPMLSLIHI